MSQKLVDGFNSNLACGCNWFSRCALFYGDLKLPRIKKLSLHYFFFTEYTENNLINLIQILHVHVTGHS